MAHALQCPTLLPLVPGTPANRLPYPGVGCQMPVSQPGWGRQATWGDGPRTCPHLPPDNVPNAVWIWDIRKLRLFVVLEQLGPVRTFQWDPQQPRLAICTGGSKVYLWSPAGCVSVQVPGEGEHGPRALSSIG